MQLSPGAGVAIGLVAGGALVAGGFALRALLDDDDHAAASPSGSPLPPTPSPAPGPSPVPPGRRVDAGSGVELLTDRYLELYDHSRDGVIEIGWSQQYGADERVTGEVGDIHTMVEFFRQADVDGDERVTRDELRSAIAGYDTRGTVGFNPNAPQIGDGRLDVAERLTFEHEVIGSQQPDGEPIDPRGVPQILSSGEHNEPFFRALPDYRALD
jgi:hypothetical protein